ncbi:MAG: hypothetical protein HYX47_19080 [Burkholderiales bacterium]|nr:hypothetical protein [Burkholderiales bacterium]
MRTLSRLENLLLAALAGLLALAVFGPAVSQPASYHAFADQRAWLGIPFAMDVLSNLPFAVAGLAGAWALWRAPAGVISNVQRAMAALFFGGLVLTALGSSWYHLRPDDAGLVIDRCGMSVAFAGLLGLAAAGRVSERAGAALGLAVLLLAPLSVQRWSQTGNLLPWLVLQFGGMALVLALACIRPRLAALDIRWGAIILVYAAAKLFELADHEIHALAGELVSGHTLKHIAAAAAGWPVIAALGRLREARQNAAGTRTLKTQSRRLARSA